LLAWLSKCRAILVRFAKKSSNYLAVIQLACILLTCLTFPYQSE